MHIEFNGGQPVMFTQGLCSAKLSMTNVPPRFYYWPDDESRSSSNSADSTCRRQAAASSRGKHPQVVYRDDCARRMYRTGSAVASAVLNDECGAMGNARHVT